MKTRQERERTEHLKMGIARPSFDDQRATADALSEFAAALFSLLSLHLHDVHHDTVVRSQSAVAIAVGLATAVVPFFAPAGDEAPLVPAAAAALIEAEAALTGAVEILTRTDGPDSAVLALPLALRAKCIRDLVVKRRGSNFLTHVPVQAREYCSLLEHALRIAAGEDELTSDGVSAQQPFLCLIVAAC